MKLIIAGRKEHNGRTRPFTLNQILQEPKDVYQDIYGLELETTIKSLDMNANSLEAEKVMIDNLLATIKEVENKTNQLDTYLKDKNNVSLQFQTVEYKFEEISDEDFKKIYDSFIEQYKSPSLYAYVGLDLQRQMITTVSSVQIIKNMEKKVINRIENKGKDLLNKRFNLLANDQERQNFTIMAELSLLNNIYENLNINTELGANNKTTLVLTEGGKNFYTKLNFDEYYQGKTLSYLEETYIDDLKQKIGTTTDEVKTIKNHSRGSLPPSSIPTVVPNNENKIGNNSSIENGVGAFQKIFTDLSDTARIEEYRHIFNEAIKVGKSYKTALDIVIQSTQAPKAMYDIVKEAIADKIIDENLQSLSLTQNKNEELEKKNNELSHQHINLQSALNGEKEVSKSLQASLESKDRDFKHLEEETKNQIVDFKNSLVELDNLRDEDKAKYEKELEGQKDFFNEQTNKTYKLLDDEKGKSAKLENDLSNSQKDLENLKQEFEDYKKQNEKTNNQTNNRAKI